MKKITPILPNRFNENGITKDNFLHEDGLEIHKFIELREAVAELSCLHPDSILFFRGQHADYKRVYSGGKKGSTFFPSIYRGNPTKRKRELNWRWNRLELATALLTKELNNLPSADSDEFKFLKSKRLAQWSVLQHYGIVDTPLLDVTQSLRVARSFADLGREKASKTAYIYAFALPYPTGRISINSEHYLTNIRLLSIIPSIVRRPHNQEGLLVVEDDMVRPDFVSEKLELKVRAVAKFKIFIGEDEFWGTSNSLIDRPLTEAELYPDKDEEEKDVLYMMCQQIKDELDRYQTKDTDTNLDTFIDLWNKIEYYLLGYQREMYHDHKPTVAKTVRKMYNYGKDRDDVALKELSSELKQLTSMRNAAVHYSKESVNMEEAIFLAKKPVDSIEKGIPGINKMAEAYYRKKHRT